MLLLLAAFAAPVLATAPPDAKALQVSPPVTILEIDREQLAGEPARISWSPDGAELYLQMVEDPSSDQARLAHYLIALDGSPPRPTDREPNWANEYWRWKSAPTAPGASDLAISVEERRSFVRASDPRRGGRQAGFGGDPTSISTPNTMATAQRATIMTLQLKSKAIGEWVNEPIQPGLTFGWAPSGSELIAFTDSRGRLVIMDRDGHTQRVAKTKDGQLPAWSPDGARIAYLQRKGGRTLLLNLLEVVDPSSE